MALWKTLYESVPRSQRAMQIVSSIGMDTGRLFPDQAPADLWQKILEQAAPANRLPALIQAVLNDPGTARAHPLLRQLLNGAPVSLDHEPSEFLSGASSTVFEPEALLFHDDLTLETGRVPWLIGVLKRMVELAPAVCRLKVGYGDGAQQRGTAFRIGPDVLLTNWHVLIRPDTLAPPVKVVAEFGYETDAEGNDMPATQYSCRADSILTNREDDWGVIRMEGSLPPDIPIIEINESVQPALNKRAFILQHPQGERKRLAYARNLITHVDARVVHYITDTQVGSSGSPVFDEQGHLIAYHRAGGKPQEFAGGPPVKKNEGIRISQILPALAKAGVIS